MTFKKSKIARRSALPYLGLLLGCLTIIGPFCIDAVLPAFGEISYSFSVTKSEVQQIITAYLVPYTCMSIVHGPLSDSFGRKRVILGGLATFIFASVGCALSTSFGELLLFRALQGLSAGVGLIVGRAVIRDVLSGPEAQRIFTQISMIFGIAPAVAPIIGGQFIQFGWYSTFWFAALLAFLLLIATGLLLPETHAVHLRSGPSLSGAMRTYCLMLSSRRFLLLSFSAALNFSALWMYICSAPSIVMDVLGLTETQFGWFFIPMISGMILSSFVSSRIASSVDANWQISGGFMVCVFAMFLNVVISSVEGLMILPWAVIPLFISAFGISLVFPVITLAVIEMYPMNRGAASSLQAFCSLAVNSLIAALIVPLVHSNPLMIAIFASILTISAVVCWRYELHRFG